jgi:hypothetical protein
VLVNNKNEIFNYFLFCCSLIYDLYKFVFLTPNENSQYRGYKWDGFYSELPSALRLHLNGNTIYNTSNPVFQRLLKVLESEVGTTGSAVAYDFRLSQIVQEVKTGEKAALEFSDSDLPSPPPYTNLFHGLNDFQWDDVLKETSLIGNYATTNMVDSYLDQEAIIHGAVMHLPWNSKVLGNISLVVSDWDPSNSHILLKSLESSTHPFAEIVVMVPSLLDNKSLETIGNVSINFVARGSNPDFMDVCAAPVSNPWVMKTTSYYGVRQIVPLLVHKSDDYGHRPVITYSKPTKSTCFDFESCIGDLTRAKLISNSVNRIFDDLDMIYDTEFLAKYCSFVAALDQYKTLPSATEYIAYLDFLDQTESIYFLSDRERYGLHSPFLLLPENDLPASLVDHRHLQGQNATNSTCSQLATEEDCTSANCEWRENLKSCRLNPDNLIEENSRNIDKRPKGVTALISIAIICASLALITLMYAGFKKYQENASGNDNSLVPMDGSNNPNSQSQAHQQPGQDDVDSSLLLASDMDYSRHSFQSVDLGDGRFDENSNGVEFLKN